MFRRQLGQALLAMAGISIARVLPPPPDRPGLGSTFKRPVKELDVGDINSGGSITIGNPVPAELVTFYSAAFGGSVVLNNWEGWFKDPTHYFYKVSGHTNDGRDFIATGYFNNGTIVPEDNSLVKTSDSTSEYDLSADSISLSANNALLINDATGAPVSFGNDQIPVPVSMSGIPHGNGIVKGVRVTVTTGVLAGPASAQTDIVAFHMTVNVVAGRTYRIGFSPGLITGTVATDTCNVTVRRDTALSGPTLAFKTDMAGRTPCYEEQWQPSVTEAVSLFMSIARAAGTGTFTVTGSPGSGVPRGHFYVEDISDDTNWGNV